MGFLINYHDQSIDSLVDLGVNGFYPLFDRSWIDEVQQTGKIKLTKKDQLRAKKIISRLSKHPHISRKKIVLRSLIKEERDIFIKTFLKMVERRILDKKGQIH
ncbi:MAG: hypothetical protein OXB84_00530 [Halobacteriovoraceae bacterium]|nr:hypothetical protein [Halobacteriovoraceae bacterium]